MSDSNHGHHADTTAELLDHGDTHGHASLKGYLIGFGLSVVLTAIPFWLVMSGTLGSANLTGFVIMGFALVQILVHMRFFLHLDGKSEGGWTIMATMFTLVLVVIALTGSLWVMYHLNSNMMPGMRPGEISADASAM